MRCSEMAPDFDVGPGEDLSWNAARAYKLVLAVVIENPISSTLFD